MRWHWTLVLIPFVLLLTFILLKFSRILPKRLSTGLIGFSALLLSALPVNANEPPAPTCYIVAPPEPVQDPLTQTQVWQNYKAAYTQAMDYLIAEKTSPATKSSIIAKLEAAKVKLMGAPETKVMGDEAVEDVHLGIIKRLAHRSSPSKTNTKENDLIIAVDEQLELYKSVKNGQTYNSNSRWELDQKVFKAAASHMSLVAFYNYRLLMLNLAGI